MDSQWSDGSLAIGVTAITGKTASETGGVTAGKTEAETGIAETSGGKTSGGEARVTADEAGGVSWNGTRENLRVTEVGVAGVWEG